MARWLVFTATEQRVAGYHVVAKTPELAIEAIEKAWDDYRSERQTGPLSFLSPPGPSPWNDGDQIVVIPWRSRETTKFSQSSFRLVHPVLEGGEL